jgi:hypothetical protein
MPTQDADDEIVILQNKLYIANGTIERLDEQRKIAETALGEALGREQNLLRQLRVEQARIDRVKLVRPDLLITEDDEDAYERVYQEFGTNGVFLGEELRAALEDE